MTETPSLFEKLQENHRKPIIHIDEVRTKHGLETHVLVAVNGRKTECKYIPGENGVHTEKGNVDVCRILYVNLNELTKTHTRE